MKYICLVYTAQNNLYCQPCVSCLPRIPKDSDCTNYAKMLRDNGNLVTREAFAPAHTATTVQVRDGKLVVLDSALACHDAQLTEFYLLHARDLNQAILLAAGIPAAKVSSIEIRPIRALQS